MFRFVNSRNVITNLIQNNFLMKRICVLHDERFLAKIGWGANAHNQDFGQPTVKSQMLNLIRSIRTVAKIPLIFLNVVAIVIKLILG